MPEQPALPMPGPVLVTGASGFIGRALCEALQRAGVEVVGVGRRYSVGPWHRFLEADLSHAAPAAASVGAVDTVFHLAGRAHALDERRQRESLYERENVHATARVLELASELKVRRLVFFSSIKVMGEGGEHAGRPTSEADQPEPVTAYGRSKLAAERLLSAQEAVATVSLRLPLVYGPGARGNLEKMIAAIRKGWFPPLPEGGAERSMVHLHNVLLAAGLAATHEAARGAYFVTDARDYTSAEIQGEIRSALGMPAPGWRLPMSVLRLLALAGDGAGWLLRRRVGFDTDGLDKLMGPARYSSHRIRTELGFVPGFDLAHGVAAMVHPDRLPAGKPDGREGPVGPQGSTKD